MTVGTLIGVGVGPGNPDLLTIRAINVLREADHVLVPVADTGEKGRAEQTIEQYIDPAKVTRLEFALSNDKAARDHSWNLAGTTVVKLLSDGGTAAFATIGDPNLYSTFTYLAQTVLAMQPGITVGTVPGITAMQDLAAVTGTVLAEGNERLMLLPLVDEEMLQAAFTASETVVFYKGGRHLSAVVEAAESAGRLDGAVYGAMLGLPSEEIVPLRSKRNSAGPYLSTVIINSPRTGRGSKL